MRLAHYDKFSDLNLGLEAEIQESRSILELLR